MARPPVCHDGTTVSGPTVPSRNPRVAAAVAGLAALAAGLGLAACSSGPERDTAAFCTAYVDVARLATAIDDPDDLTLPQLRDRVGAVDDAAADAAEVAPEEIAATVDEVIAPLHELRRALDDAGGRTAANGALGDYRTAVGQVASAQRRLDTWADGNCGVVPVTSTTVPVTIHPGITG